ncbi:MAG: Cthe_2314 family HEPN domain-containing protein [Defluviitaleaceae bacterium]|nr:Cthe_2314 family HEPN domain-containing protein [Defluviitaleaceae bacterium]
MDLNSFKTDQEIILHIGSWIDEIEFLDECRLSKKEQLHLFTATAEVSGKEVLGDEVQVQLLNAVLRIPNCIEWIIRSNGVIFNIKYALARCLEFAEKMLYPLEKTENQKFYAYYLEDAVCRNLTLWDMFRQLLNEFYDCGYSENDSVSIFKFLKEKKPKIGNERVEKIQHHLNDSAHKMVRDTLRNSFVHSVDPTSSYIFHRTDSSGKVRPQFEYFLPEHPFNNLNFIIADTHKLIEFMTEVICEMLLLNYQYVFLFSVDVVMPCGKNFEDPDYWNLGVLKDRYEKLVCPCLEACDKAHLRDGVNLCKPVEVRYSRNSCEGGFFVPKMSFLEMEKTFGKVRIQNNQD